MVYKLDDADKLCGINYIDWSKKYSPIPKATCEMIQPKCSSGGGGSYDDAVELKCEDLKKMIHGEDKPKEDKQKEDTPKEDKPQENKPKEDEKPKEEETPRENNTPREEKPNAEDATPKENEPAPSPRVEETPAEPTPEPPVADTPREDTPTEGNASDHLGDTHTDGNPEVNLLELMPRVEDKFSEVMFHKDGTIWAVTEQRPEQKEAFERKVIETLKSKLPEGAVVEAVLGEPFFKVDDKYVEGKSNYTLNVRVTLNGKVYEQEYNVPHVASTSTGVTDYI